MKAQIPISARSLRSLAATLAALSVLGCPALFAQTVNTWTGATSGTWDTTSQNWTTSGTPGLFTSGDDVLFTGTPTTNVTSASGLTVGNITLDNTFTGTVTLTGNNTVNGTTLIDGGILAISALTGQTIIGQLGSSAITIDDGTLQVNLSNKNISLPNSIAIGSGGGTLAVLPGTAAVALDLATTGQLTGSGTLTITGNGTSGIIGGNTSVVAINAVNSGFTGNVVIQDGATLEMDNASGVGSGSTFIVNNNSVLSTAGVTIANNVVLNAGSTLAFQNNASGVFAGDITLNGNASIRLENWWSTATYNGEITGTISGSETLDIYTTANNTGTGNTLTLQGDNATASSANLVLNGASLTFDNSANHASSDAITRANSLTINTGNLNINGSAYYNSNDVVGTLNLGGGSAGNLQGYSTWTLTPNANSNAALTFTNMGTVATGSWVYINGTVGSAAGTTEGGGNIYFTNGLSGNNLIGGGGSYTSQTASIVPWMRNNAGQFFTYDPTIGVVAIGNTTTSITAGSTYNVGLANNVNVTLSSNTTINSLAMATNAITMNGYTLTVTSGAISSGINGTIGSDGTGVLEFGSAEAILDAVQARTLTINSAIDGTGGLTFVGFYISNGNAGNMTLGGANTYTGVTNFYGYGKTATITLNNSLALQNTTLNHVSGRAYNLVFGSGNTSYTFGGLEGNANQALTNSGSAAVALTVGSAADSDSTTYSGVLSGTGGSLIKAGSGTLTLSGANTYTGSTTVSSGTLALATGGSLASTAYVINTGATFDVSALSSYTLASVATTINIGATTAGLFNAGSHILTLGNALTLNLLTSTFTNGQTFDLFDFGSKTGDFTSVTLTGSLTGSLVNSSGIWTGADSTNAYDFTFNESTGVLSVASAIPEPATCATLAGLAALGLAFSRRRRKA